MVGIFPSRFPTTPILGVTKQNVILSPVWRLLVSGYVNKLDNSLSCRGTLEFIAIS